MTVAFRTAAVVAFDRAESRTRRNVRQPTQDWCIVAFDLGRWMAQTARDMRAAHKRTAGADDRVRADWTPGDKL